MHVLPTLVGFFVNQVGVCCGTESEGGWGLHVAVVRPQPLCTKDV